MMFWDKLAKYARRDEAIPHLLTALYHMFSHWGSQFAVSIIGTIVIGVLSGGAGNTGWLIGACVAFAIFELGTLLSQQYKEQRKKQREDELNERLAEKEKLNQCNKLLMAVMSSTRALDTSASAGIYRNARKIKYHGWVSSLEDMREAFGFQDMAMQVCQEVYRVLHEQLGLNDHSVTVFQRFEKTSNNSICKMIAYSVQNGHEPSSYSQEYSIPKKFSDQSGTRKVPFHTRIFVENNTEIRAIVNNAEIIHNFKFHKDCEVRERAIEQYIGIPMNVCNRGVIFILQIDSNVRNTFGTTEEEVRTFAKQYLYQYASHLALYYEMDRMMEVANTHESKGKNTQDKGGTEGVA